MSLLLSRVVYITENIQHLLAEIDGIYRLTNMKNEHLTKLYDIIDDLNITKTAYISEGFYTRLQDLSFLIKHTTSRDVWQMNLHSGNDRAFVIDLSYSLFYEIVVLENNLREYMKTKQEVKAKTFGVSHNSAFGPVDSRRNLLL